MLLLGAVEVVAAVCFASYLYVGQGVVVGYKAEAEETSDNAAMKTNTEIMHVGFFTFVNLLVCEPLYVHDQIHITYGLLEKERA